MAWHVPADPNFHQAIPDTWECGAVWPKCSLSLVFSDMPEAL